jgi:UDP-galactopyranose mutase
VIARLLCDAGHSVLILERRPHIGGNAHDHWHPSGIRIHTYGPHYFRCNDENVWAFVNRFSQFYEYEAVLKSYVDGEYENWPIAASYIRRVAGEGWQPDFAGTPRNFEEESLAMMPRIIYEKFVKGYTEKQWGVPANTLSVRLARRFDVRLDDEPRLKRHHHQALPVEGYSSLMRNMLIGIPVVLNCDYLKVRDCFSVRKRIIFTGPIDEYFSFDLGKLKYRGQKRSHEYVPDVRYAQPCVQVNTPSPALAHIRSIEWKHMMQREFAERIRGSVVTKETPVTPEEPSDYEYPFPDQANSQLYEAYRERARTTPNLLICGRLGDYRYYDMDQAIARAMLLAERIKSGSSS